MHGLYSTKATATGGRDGEAATADGSFKVKLSTPKELGGIGPRSEGGFGIDVGLEIALPGMPKPEAEALVAKAHQVCPYSSATRNNVPVRLKVV